jgi:hypothetical protein
MFLFLLHVYDCGMKFRCLNDIRMILEQCLGLVRCYCDIRRRVLFLATMSSDWLLPVSSINYAFSTYKNLQSRAIIVKLEDKELGVHKVSSRTTRNIVQPPATTPDDGNSPEFARRLAQEEVNEAVMSYRVMFEEGFDFVKGGKLPGICKWLFTRL